MTTRQSGSPYRGGLRPEALREQGNSHRDAAPGALDAALKKLPPEKLDFAGLLEHTPLPWPDRVEVNALRAEIEHLLKPQQ